MGNPNFVLAKSKKGISNQIHQYIGTWSDHVNSWINNFNDDELLVIKYEDLKEDAITQFKKMIDFTGFEKSMEEIQLAVEKSSFKNLKKMESQDQFKENISPQTPFFRKGKVGSWREELSESQVQQLIQDHSVAMQSLGYLDANHNLLF